MDTKKEQKKYGKYGDRKIRTNMTLTPQALSALDDAAEKEGLNRSEIVERFARGLELDVTPKEAYLLGELSANCY